MKSIWLVMVVLVVSAASCKRDKSDAPSSPPSAAAPSDATTAPTTAPETPPPPPDAPASVPAAPVAPAGRPFAGYPPLEDACAADGDCVLVLALRAEPGLTGCCMQCNVYLSGTQAWADAAVAACNAAGPCSDQIPCPATARNPFMPACEQGRCVVKKDPAVWGDAA
jgi:hypothetical protein